MHGPNYLCLTNENNKRRVSNKGRFRIRAGDRGAARLISTRVLTQAITVYINISIYIYIYMYASIYVSTYVYIYIYIYIYIYKQSLGLTFPIQKHSTYLHCALATCQE